MSSLRSVATPTATARSHPTLESTAAATPKRSEACHSLPSYRKAHVATSVRMPHMISTWLGVGWGSGKTSATCLGDPLKSSAVGGGGGWWGVAAAQWRRGLAGAFHSAQKSMSLG